MVIRLITYVRIPRDAHRRKITRRAVFARDRWTCQYCGQERGTLTVDHVIPRSKGGGSTWDNIVDLLRALQPAQGRPAAGAGEHGPAQARRAPSSTIFIHVAAPVIPEVWEQYLPARGLRWKPPDADPAEPPARRGDPDARAGDPGRPPPAAGAGSSCRRVGRRRHGDRADRRSTRGDAERRVPMPTTGAVSTRRPSSRAHPEGLETRVDELEQRIEDAAAAERRHAPSDRGGAPRRTRRSATTTPATERPVRGPRAPGHVRWTKPRPPG